MPPSPTPRIQTNMTSAPTNYTQGYSKATTSSHASRTAQSDAVFLLPHLRPTSSILDIGCGPATITIGLAATVPNGSVTAVELTDEILAQARENISSVKPTPPTNITLVKADLLAGLPFKDGMFDVVFASQLFPHLRAEEVGVQALREMRRVVKEGGIVVTRDAAELHFYPRSYELDRLWAGSMARVLGGSEGGRFPGGEMPGLYRRAGFDREKMVVGAGTTVYSGERERRWFAEGCLGRLTEGDEFRGSWVRARITEEEIEETKEALRAWMEDQDAWYVAVQTEILAWK
ncbi:methyltransferase [Immersiella caudata]|uniref:Methyltransferase n=1 Tax=Immersiella caudata TaxID=314043 RepID=A0AA39XCW6_9PEZI|nr:methyltransferase [Immersiella caudata]